MEDDLEDPIVAEARRAGLEMEREAGGDVHQYFENLRKAEEKCKDRPVRVVTPSTKPPESGHEANN